MEREGETEKVGRIGPAVLLTASLLLLAFAGLVFFWGPRFIEKKIRQRLVEEAARRGVELVVKRISFHWKAPLELSGVEAARDPLRVSLGVLRIDWSWKGQGLLDRIKGFDYEGLRVELPGEVVMDSAKERWRIRSLSREGTDLERSGTTQRISLRRSRPDTFHIEAAGLDIEPWLRVRQGGRDVVRKGRFSGVIEVLLGGAVRKASFLVRAEGLELPDIETDKHGLEPMAPRWIEIAGDVVIRGRNLELNCLSLKAPGIDVNGRGRILRDGREVWVESVIESASVNLTAVLGMTGVRLPDALSSVADLGVARLTGEISGALLRPDSWKVTYRLDFDPPAEAVAALARYRGPFVQTVEWPKGHPYRFPVASGSPAFVPFDRIPPLVVRALLVAEDSAFFGHAGIDLQAIPVALSLNLTRGGPPRGASTITQQTVKNLFLSKERTLRRKLQELCLALLIEKSLGKQRILEIYVNLIEWGPGIYGLGRASRHYFSKEPAELTPREIAFLVTLIPGPVKYQSSFSSGVPSKWFSSMIDRLLVKLASVNAIDEEALQAALEEQLVIGSGQTAEPVTD